MASRFVKDKLATSYRLEKSTQTQRQLLKICFQLFLSLKDKGLSTFKSLLVTLSTNYAGSAMVVEFGGERREAEVKSFALHSLQDTNLFQTQTLR